MRQILFVQGGGEDVHDQWDNKLVDSLRRELGPGFEIRYPVMPNEGDPAVATWGPTLEHELATLPSGAIVVGHSIGGSILIEVLSRHPHASTLAAIVLIATPFIGPGGWESDDMAPHSELATRLPRGVPVFLYHGDHDDIAPVAHLGLFARTIPHAHVRRLAHRDHQLDNDLSEVARDIRERFSSHGTPR